MFAIPFIGPVLEFLVKPVFDWLNKKEDTKVKLDSNDVEVINARVQAIISTQSDPGVRLARDAAMWFPILYVNTYIWDRWVEISHPTWVWGVKSLDLNWSDCMPIMAVYAFLFAMSWRGK